MKKNIKLVNIMILIITILSLSFTVKAEDIKKYTVSQGEKQSQQGNKTYIKVLKDTLLIPDSSSKKGNAKERYVMKSKCYEAYDAGDKYKITVGSVTGSILKVKASKLKNEPYNKLTLGWNEIVDKKDNQKYYAKEDSGNYLMKSSAETGLDVICPTWFYLDGDPNVAANIKVCEKGDEQYSKAAHKNGYEVWAVLSDSNKEIEKDSNYRNRAEAVFNDKKVKERVIQQVLTYAEKFDIDGINIDFEGLGEIEDKDKNKDEFTSFVKDIAKALKAKGIKISVDVTKYEEDSYYSAFYDRKKLTDYVDYLILMAYDEHYAGCFEAGSIASHEWVKSSIDEMVYQEEIPENKIILGVPFYTRDFGIINITPSKDQIIVVKQTPFYSMENGKLKVQGSCKVGQYFENIMQEDKEHKDFYKVQSESKVLYISKNDTRYSPANVKRLWVVEDQLCSMKDVEEIKSMYTDNYNFYDEYVRQNVLEYHQVDKTGSIELQHLIWLEDETSMNWRMDLISQYHLAGMGAWKLYDEKEDIWSLIKQKLKVF